jgi:hypothetical protein
VIGPIGVSGPFLIASGATILAAVLAVRVRAPALGVGVRAPARYLSTK